MNIEDYIKGTRETVIYGKELDIPYLSQGLGEAGELQGKLKKLWRDFGIMNSKHLETFYTPRYHGYKELDQLLKGIQKELGDLFYYTFRIIDTFGFDFEEILQLNHDELMSRKKRGVLKGSGDNR